MKKRLLFVIFAALLAVLAACGFGDDNSDETGDAKDSTQGESDSGKDEKGDDEASGGKVINLVEEGEIPTLDSAHAHDGYAFTVLNNVNEGLFRSDDTHTPQLAMAEDHQTNEDETVHTFTIRDAKWSNGDPVTAHDFEYGWKRVLEVVGHYNVMMETASVKNAAAIIEGEMDPDELGVEAKDDKTLVVTLENPNPLFMHLLTFPTFLPQNQKFVEEAGEAYGTEADKVLFNGPFVLDSWQHEQGWTYLKNEDYWDADAVNLDQINVNVVKETSTAVNLWETGEVDRLLLSSAYVDEYKDDENFYVDVIATIHFMRFNHNLEHFKNENIRRAIDMAIDKDGLTDTILNDGSIPLYSLIPKEFSYHPETDEDFRDLNGDFNQGSVEEAQELWEKGLSEVGIDGFEMKLTVADDDNNVKSAQFIKNQLETNLPGISVEIKTVPFEARLEQEKAVEYDMVLSTWGPDYNDPLTYIDMWVTEGPANRMDFSDEEYDKMVDEIMFETDQAKRYQIMLDAEKKLLEEMHIAPLYQRADSILMRKNIKNMVRHPSAPEHDYKWVDVE